MKLAIPKNIYTLTLDKGELEEAIVDYLEASGEDEAERIDEEAGSVRNFKSLVVNSDGTVTIVYYIGGRDA